MYNVCKLLFLNLFILLNTLISPVMADEIYYPPDVNPLNRYNPIAGETDYRNRPVFTKHNGIDFYLYNDGSGDIELNLELLERQYTFTSIPVVSPNFNNIIYTQTFYYDSANQVVSKAFYAPVIPPKNLIPSKEDFLNSYKLKAINNYRHQILSVESENLEKNLFRTLTMVDWSYDSSKAIIKERIGIKDNGIYSTNIWIYDVLEDKIIMIDSIKKAIIYYWLKEKSLDLNQYCWDIKVLGWEKDSKNKIFVNAFLYPAKNKSTFLGCWSIYVDTNIVKLVSLDQQDLDIERAGLIPEEY